MERTRAISTNMLAVKVVQLKATAFSAPKCSGHTLLSRLEDSTKGRMNNKEKRISASPIEQKIQHSKCQLLDKNLNILHNGVISSSKVVVPWKSFSTLLMQTQLDSSQYDTDYSCYPNKMCLHEEDPKNLSSQ